MSTPTNYGATKTRNVEYPIAALYRILGPMPFMQSVGYKRSQMRELFQYLKNLRRFDSTKETLTVRLLGFYFPEFADEIWKQSKKPFAGYTGAAYISKKRLRKAKDLGLDVVKKKRWRARFLGADLIFFSGHHYARYDSPGEFDYLNIRNIRFTAPRVKLIMISSCAGLRRNAMKLWKRRFPNAYIIGWRFGSPLNQKGIMRRFLEHLPDDLLLDQKADIDKLLQLWRSFVEGLSEGKEGFLPHGLGYATPQGDITFCKVMKKGKCTWLNAR